MIGILGSVKKTGGKESSMWLDQRVFELKIAEVELFSEGKL